MPSSDDVVVKLEKWHHPILLRVDINRQLTTEDVVHVFEKAGFEIDNPYPQASFGLQGPAINPRTKLFNPAFANVGIHQLWDARRGEAQKIDLWALRLKPERTPELDQQKRLELKERVNGFRRWWGGEISVKLYKEDYLLIANLGDSYIGKRETGDPDRTSWMR